MVRIIQAIFLLALLTGPGYAVEQLVDHIKEINDQLNVIENDLKKGSMEIEETNSAAQQLNNYKIETDNCITDAQKVITDSKTSLEALGEKKQNELPEVRAQRKDLELSLSIAEAKLANCTALNLRVSNIAQQLESQRKAQISERLLAENPDIFEVLLKNIQEPPRWWTEVFAIVNKHAWIHKAHPVHLILLVASIILGIGVGVYLRSRGSKYASHMRQEDSLGSRLAIALMSTASRDTVFIAASLVPAVYLSIITKGITPLPLASALAYALSFFFIVRLVIRVAFKPVTPAVVFDNLEPEVSHSMARRLVILLFVIVVSYVILNTILIQALPEYTRQLLATTLRLIFAVNILWVLWLFRHLRGVLQTAWFRFGLSLVVVIGIAADLLGYTNLAGWLFRAVFGSLLALILVLVVGRIFREMLIGLEYGHTQWQRTFRDRLGLATSGRIQGFFWIRFAVNTGLLLLLIWVLMRIWDLSDNVVQDLNFLFTQGFTIGSLKIVPSKILMALLSLGVLVAASTWIKGQLESNLEKSPIERGGREALVAITGYLGISIAIIVALGIAGLDFSNLAIIAGALSVGIGFGLQNIVNNFISGLILLFERPVKTGDWIVVGNTEGYVKRIRIRSTQIQTFDRADVIVPNSELISGQVTNWMLHDSMGRAVIPVGVAYGSDTQKVKQILLQVASEHPAVTNDDSAPEPYVLFREFGDSSLNFELRCYIKNIDSRLSVISDLNFAIDAAFRENGIEIPFPQRDLHVKNWPGKPETE